MTVLRMYQYRSGLKDFWIDINRKRHTSIDCDLIADLYTSDITRAGPFFFFQAEDGIRDYKVTGVQTCALPIFETPTAVRVAKPLVGGSFEPARLYADRAGGVVTIFSFFGSERQATQAAQGSGFVDRESGG